jgi:SAM-dependent methyltransferase
VSDLRKYRGSEQETARTADLLRILPRGRHSVLDIGARDGHFSLLLTEYFSEVTALDLQRPAFAFPNVTTVAGDVTKLEFDDASFDCVFCAEVLEHIPDVSKACAEILRVARHEIVIGVPFRQDTRVGRCTCSSCGKTNPPWGHVNSFDEDRLLRLFAGARLLSTSFVGTDASVTNPFSDFLMDLGGNPWGSYDQDEPCNALWRTNDSAVEQARVAQSVLLHRDSPGQAAGESDTPACELDSYGFFEDKLNCRGNPGQWRL